MNKSIRCMKCSAAFTNEETKDAQACPVCGTTAPPLQIEDDVTIKINWHELRILTIWASNWEEQVQEDENNLVTPIICARLERQFPNKTPLTLAGEVRQIQETYPDTTLTDSDGRILIPPKKVQ